MNHRLGRYEDFLSSAAAPSNPACLISAPRYPATFLACALAFALLHREKAVKKRPIAAQRKTEILGRDITTAIPLALESRSFSREHFSQALHRHYDETICLLHHRSRLVNKTHLDRIPPDAKIP